MKNGKPMSSELDQVNWLIVGSGKIARHYIAAINHVYPYSNIIIKTRSIESCSISKKEYPNIPLRLMKGMSKIILIRQKLLYVAHLNFTSKRSRELSHLVLNSFTVRNRY